MITDIWIFFAEGVWSVCADGAVVVESRAVLEVMVGDAPVVIYFSSGDVAIAFLDLSDIVSTCLVRGFAWYFNIVILLGMLVDVGWFYDSLFEEFVCLRGHLAFDVSKVMVEWL